MTRWLTILLALALCTSCLSLIFTQDEVARVMSPSGKVEAIIVETNGGATTALGYNVYLVLPSRNFGRGVRVASFYGAGRSGVAYGVNLRWQQSDHLIIEFLEARSSRLLKEVAQVSNEKIKVELRSGINDPNAPGGGMLYNLQQKGR